MDCVKVGSFCSLCNVKLSCCCATLSLCTLLKVGLCIPNHISNEFTELGCMLCLLKGIATESLTNFWITLTMCLTRHCKIHTNLCALAFEVSLQPCHYFLWASLCNTNLVLTYKCEFLILNLIELTSWSLAQWACLRCLFSFVDVTANCTNEFLFHSFSFLSVLL